MNEINCGSSFYERIVLKKDDGEMLAYVPERTCTRGEEFWECTECGKHGLMEYWNYCPNCGAKVVDE